MRQWVQAVGVAAFLILFGFSSCGDQNGRPRAGDTVTPQLEWPVLWTAGQPGDLGIRLYTQAKGDQRRRLLNFGSIPLHVNPVANLTFYRGDEPLSSPEIPLSHRC